MQIENIRVLVIDSPDSIKKIIRPTLTRNLGFQGQNIYEANDGKRALEILNSTQIDLVLCEWNIPNISGIELLKFIRKDGRMASLPFIMVTSESDSTFILQAAQEHVTQYVVKPFTPDSFSTKIKKALEPKERRAHERHPANAKNKLTILVKGKPLTSGEIINVSKGGLLAQLVLHRGLTVYDQLTLNISFGSADGKQLTDTLLGELIRLERVTDTPNKKTAYFTFMFIGLDDRQKEFLESLITALQKKPTDTPT